MSTKTRRKELDWTGVGAFIAVLLDLFRVIRNTLSEMEVGIEIIPWLIGDGKTSFVEKILMPLGKIFLTEQRVKALDNHTIMVNLNVLALKGTEHSKKIEKHIGDRWVKVEKCADGLYIDNRKVILYLSERQKKGNIRWAKLRDELLKKPVLNACVLYALLEYQHLIPEEWKNDQLRICFWGSNFRYSFLRPYILIVKWNLQKKGVFGLAIHWLNNDLEYYTFRDNCPAALTED